MLGIETGEHLWRRQPQEQVHTDGTTAAGEEAVRAERFRHDERPSLGPPERDLLPTLPAPHLDDLERRARHRRRSDEMRHTELLGHGTVALPPSTGIEGVQQPRAFVVVPHRPRRVVGTPHGCAAEDGRCVVRVHPVLASR